MRRKISLGYILLFTILHDGKYMQIEKKIDKLDILGIYT